MPWPYQVLTINRQALVDAINASVGKVKYRLGAKPKMSAVPGQPGFRVCDCSGYVRWMLHQLGVHCPDGSWYQQDWCKQRGFKSTTYSNARLSDDRLRLAFINTAPGKVGHVWFIINGYTIECYGGHGTGRRPWNANLSGGRRLDTLADACYVLTGPLS